MQATGELRLCVGDLVMGMRWGLFFSNGNCRVPLPRHKDQTSTVAKTALLRFLAWSLLFSILSILSAPPSLAQCPVTPLAGLGAPVGTIPTGNGATQYSNASDNPANQPKNEALVAGKSALGRTPSVVDFVLKAEPINQGCTNFVSLAADPAATIGITGSVINNGEIIGGNWKSTIPICFVVTKAGNDVAVN